jgi:hypothetical protein
MQGRLKTGHMEWPEDVVLIYPAFSSVRARLANIDELANALAGQSNFGVLQASPLLWTKRRSVTFATSLRTAAHRQRKWVTTPQTLP